MKNNIKTSNIPSMPISRLVDLLSSMWCEAIETGMPFDRLPAPMIWGPPGVGKSQAVRQIKTKIEKRTGRCAAITDVRLLLFNPIDLRGIPVPSEGLAKWLRPEIFDMDPDPDTVNILFLDEISAAPQSVQAAAYQLVLDRACGEHKLPDNCIVIAAGNRVTDKSVAFKMPKALANRLLHLEAEVDSTAWRKWAAHAGIHPLVIGFIAARPDMLMRFDASDDSLAFPTPRAWELVSNLLRGSSLELEGVLPLVAGLIGEGAAIEFSSWSKVLSHLPSMEDVFSGMNPAAPKNADALYALVSAMAAYAKEHKDDMDAIGRSLAYARKLPSDFCVVLLHDYQAIEPDYGRRLMGIPEYVRLAQTKGVALNGAI